MLTGTIATIRWAYYNAAAVNGYTVARDKETGTTIVSGTIVVADAFKLSQRPLLFVAPHNKGSWVWEILDPMPRTAGPFSVRVGKQGTGDRLINV